jgi:glycogen debranching enzyme
MFVGAAAEVGGEDVTLVKGSSVCVGDASGRFPEMFTGFDRRDFPRPVPYPASCSPQAWAAAAPLSPLGSVLRFDSRPATRRGVGRSGATEVHPDLAGEQRPARR